MIKSLIAYAISFLGLSFLGYLAHINLVDSNKILTLFNIKEVYIFYGVSSFIICAVLLGLSTINKFKPQIGFLYLAALVLKIVAFCTVFYNSVFNQQKLTPSESLQLLIPLFIFLMVEVYFIARILNQLHENNFKHKK